MKYLILAYTGTTNWDEAAVSEEDVARVCREYARFEAKLKDAGEWVSSEGLADHRQTTTVSQRNGEIVATDGAYLDAKETMVSFVMVDVAAHERALEIARDLVALGGQPCEVRPVMEMDLPPDVEQ